MDRRQAVPTTAPQTLDRRHTFASDQAVLSRVVDLHRWAQVQKPSMHALVIIADLHDHHGNEAADLADPNGDKSRCDWWAWLTDRQQWNLTRNNEIPEAHQMPFVVISGPIPLICGVGFDQSPKT